MRSIFLLRETNKITKTMYETNQYNVIIPRNVVIKLFDKQFSISRTIIKVEENEVIYLLREMGDTLL